MSNPFDDEDGIFSVLVNEDNQHCLWPQSFPVPEGWRVVLSSASRADALAHVEANWRDLRPAGIVARARSGVAR